MECFSAGLNNEGCVKGRRHGRDQERELSANEPMEWEYPLHEFELLFQSVFHISVAVLQEANMQRHESPKPTH